MENGNDRQDKELPVPIQAMLLVGGIGIFVFLIYFTYSTPSVSGDTVNLWSFIAFWLREFLLLAFPAVAIVLAVIAWVFGFIRRCFSKFK
jgi:hypothetical protein